MSLKISMVLIYISLTIGEVYDNYCTINNGVAISLVYVVVNKYKTQSWVIS